MAEALQLGRPHTCAVDEAPRHDSGVILRTHRLSKKFKGFTAVDDVNLEVRAGSIHVLIGPNGAGKTTLFNLLTKFLMPSSGQIFHNGTDITRMAPAAVARRGLARSFQISAVFPHLTAEQNVRIALQRSLPTSFHFWRPISSLDCLQERAGELLQSVGLEGYEHILAAELSYGRKRALDIATTLALDPEILLLDEPMAGLGHEDIERISDLIRTVAHGRTVLMVEHNMSVVADLADVITVLQRGKVLAEGSYAEVSENPEVIEAYVGTDEI